jgi:hypothetical protein
MPAALAATSPPKPRLNEAAKDGHQDQEHDDRDQQNR